ncbi:DNA transposition protein [Aggregatibacter actinomycetemcomitans]|uniref:DNA transposition protein n=1 Tax=Aggregatibacter actinomycetemcomitans TaxID=714 RepID=A0A2G1DNK4_AGGAC|nr:AAA family ATPase [Aggregatibacter actinomycetemcomitans]PHO20030.1 DNA transposition protein [Aggregatibacter actinomycetemcomitans]PHO22233.1 DNA transposition protein [Aggregatibacter actinomycetemcomitans]
MMLRQQISALIKSGKLTQARLSRETGVNGGALSAWLNDKYTGNTETVETPIEKWLALGDRKVQVFVEPPNFIDTPTAKKVFAALDMAKFTGAIVPIYGASGVGKTKAAEEYSKCNPNVWMITISPSRAGLTAFLYELALELGIKDAPRQKARLSRAVKDKLIGTEGLVIVDESDHLTYDSIEELRYLQEKAEVGFALIGNDRVYNKMQGGINQAHEYARLWTRLGHRCPIKASTKGDIKAITEAWGLDSSDKDLMTVLNNIGTKAGGLRALTQYLRLAAISAKAQGTVISLDMILTAQKQMTGGNI